MRNYYQQIHEYLLKLIKNILSYDKKGLQVKGIDLSLLELLIIKELGGEKEKKMFEVIDALGIDRNSFVTLINKLQQQQYIIKTKSEEDKRVHLLSLSSKGEELLEEIEDKEKELLYSLLNDFSFNEEKAVLKFLVKLDMLKKDKHKEKENDI
ncbi:MarR family winged helix-turn-helix transcriptional regulator [Natronincola ferrireducens]|uniref:DNA-binding transcriptional regulator, MarR family n=1 Tax=Natronincola ferrireducens TaxID=393762 RepID=A0A1G8XUE6_9FIRM|nr:MarR family transcriptional regulator [Natronincola ferrireducens]SDJ94171.1 DNA-binding transcriptional regulator, MarR family [Natronincola ferrireducens]